ncbi:MAG: DUF6110 family protein [Eubacteriales bacterium]|nr:DUF6110 family protein [Eubacteriales bacterium]
MIEKSVAKKIALFLGGVVFGTAGVTALSSKDAKRVYTEGTAAVLRARDCVMTKVTSIRENADDILAEAKEINEKRAEEAAAKELADAAELIAEAEESKKTEADPAAFSEV